MAESSSIGARLQRFLTDRTAFAGVLFTVVLAFVHLMSLSTWDPLTAKAILDHVDVPGFLVNLAVVCLPELTAVALLSLLLASTADGHGEQPGFSRTQGIVFGAVLAVVYVVLVPLSTVALSVVAGLVVVGVVLVRRRRGDLTGRSVAALALLLSAGATLVAAAVVTSPWLPSETITSHEEDAVYTAYVVAEERREFVLLHDRPRVVSMVQIDETSRQLCAQPSPWSRSALQLLVPPRYPACT